MFDGVEIMKNIEFEKCPQEIAKRLYELAKDMDCADYEEEKEKILSELENALYWLKATASNEYNNEYFRTFYQILENI